MMLLPEASDTGSDSRVALIAPPGMHCTSPPLALAVLQSYTAQVAPKCRLRLFDLNLANYQQALSWLGQGRLPLEAPGGDVDRFAEASGQAVAYMRNPRQAAGGVDVSAYLLQLSAYLEFIDRVNLLFDQVSREYLAQASFPGWVAEYITELTGPVLKFAPGLCGISILLMRQLWPGMVIGRLLKQTGTRVVFGGATLTVKPRPQILFDESLSVPFDGGSRPIDPSECLDSLVIGEGEAAWEQLLKDPGGDLSRVPGLVYRSGGEVHTNPPGMVPDLNLLPAPDFSGLPLTEYHSPAPVLPYLSSRGCFWGRCAFCTHHKTYQSYREESVARTAANLAQLARRHGSRFFTFTDEMIHPNRFRRLAAAIQKTGLELEYLAYAKPTEGFTRPVMASLAASGLRVMQWGVESGSQRVLSRMKKGLRVEHVEAVLAAAHATGVLNMVFLLFGFPGETRAEWDETIAMVARNRENIDVVAESRFILPEGSDVFNHPADYGVMAIDQRATGIPITMAYDYQVVDGISQSEARERIETTRDKLTEYYGRTRALYRLRDHLLFLASSQRPSGGMV